MIVKLQCCTDIIRTRVCLFCTFCTHLLFLLAFDFLAFTYFPVFSSIIFVPSSGEPFRKWNNSVWRLTSSIVTISSGSVVSFINAIFVIPFDCTLVFGSEFICSSHATWNSGCLSFVFLADAVRDTADLARRINDILPRTGLSAMEVFCFVSK